MADKLKNTTIQVTFPSEDLQVWQKLVVGLKRENRFTLTEEAARFIDLLIEYARKHKTVKLTTGTQLFRARINEALENSTPIPLEHMGAPPSNLAGHGRLNPKGISYLYLASDRLTAVSEVRPWVGCKLTIAEFLLAKECEFINFSKKFMVNIPEGEEFDGPEFTWRELITWMFSAPFDPRDDTAYIPTQYLAERLKGEGLDGIIYDSTLHEEGYNVTLFDPAAATSARRTKATVSGLQVAARFEEVKEAEG